MSNQESTQPQDAATAPVTKNALLGETLHVKSTDRFDGMELINCDITLGFRMHPDGYKKPEKFEIMSATAYYSKTFLEVFKGCDLIGNRITSIT